MDQSIKISIIIPIFKVELYVKRCVESVLRQTYRNLELILVDDCTPDRSMEYAMECINANLNVNDDIKFIYLKHDHNRGLSAARNTGIDASTGEYIFFLDSDDEIPNNCIEKLINVSNRGKTDVICGKIQVECEQDSHWKNFYVDDIYIEGNKEIISYYATGRLYMMACNKMVKTRLVRQEEIFFQEGLVHEDNLWTFLLMNHTNSLKVLSDVTYIYYLRPNSIMTAVSVRWRLECLVRILETFNEAENQGAIKPYKDSFRFVDSCKYNWISGIFRRPEFSYKEKWQYFWRVAHLHRGIKFVFNFAYYRFREMLSHLIKPLLYSLSRSSK